MKKTFLIITGMDFAHVFNGYGYSSIYEKKKTIFIFFIINRYRYHTKYDHIDYLPSPVLQRTGDNILALVRRMANSDELINPDVRMIVVVCIVNNLKEKNKLSDIIIGRVLI